MNIAVIFAGGVGSRMHSKQKPKQFLEMYNAAVARGGSTSNADRWICGFYGPAGGWQHGDSSGIGGSNASAGVVHIK